MVLLYFNMKQEIITIDKRKQYEKINHLTHLEKSKLKIRVLYYYYIENIYNNKKITLIDTANRFNVNTSTVSNWLRNPTNVLNQIINKEIKDENIKMQLYELIDKQELFLYNKYLNKDIYYNNKKLIEKQKDKFLNQSKSYNSINKQNMSYVEKIDVEKLQKALNELYDMEFNTKTKKYLILLRILGVFNQLILLFIFITFKF